MSEPKVKVCEAEETPRGRYAIQIEYPFDGGKLRKRFEGPTAEEAMKLYLLWESGRNQPQQTFTERVKADGGIGPAMTELLQDSVRAGKLDGVAAKSQADYPEQSIPWDRQPFATLKDGTRFYSAEEMIGKRVKNQWGTIWTVCKVEKQFGYDRVEVVGMKEEKHHPPLPCYSWADELELVK